MCDGHLSRWYRGIRGKELAKPLSAYKRTEQEISLLDEHRLKRANKELRRKIDEALDLNTENQRYQDFIAEIAARRIEPPAWTLHPKQGKRRQAVPTALFSDAHFDEKVDPAQIGGVNGYDRKIATKRLKNFFENAIKICDEFISGVEYPGFVLAVAGDLFSGQIHEELRDTNEDVLCSSLVYWLEPMSAGINLLAERFGSVYIPWVVGNHPRLSLKPRNKGGVRDNFDWLLGQLLAREFRGNKKVQFAVSESFDYQYMIYRTRYLLTHGDQFRGGSGISAEFSPLFIGDARKRQRYQAVKTPYDVMVFGHWHRLILGLESPAMIGNGSIKGYDEYAARGNFKFERPRQAFWLTDPVHGVTIRTPIHVQSDDEPWADKKHDPSVWLTD